MARKSHAEPQNEVKAILEIAKKLLKERQLSYSDISKHWHLSLPAVKAAMNSANLPLARIISLCDLLGISLKDLLELLNRDTGKGFRITPAQEEFFSQHPSYLCYFLELLNKSPAEIERTHNITAKSSRVYLKALEKLGLIQVFPGDKIKMKARSPILWSDHGPLGAIFSKTMLLQFAAWAAKKITSPQKMFLELHGWTITPAQYEEFQREYRELAQKYREVSGLNKQVLPKEKQEYISVLMLGDYWDCPIFKEIKELG